MASSRALHRQKKKPTLNFGDFMMPLLGVLLVVILLLGLKILFFRSEPAVTPPPQPAPAVQEPVLQPQLPEVPTQGELPEVQNLTEDPATSVVVTPLVEAPKEVTVNEPVVNPTVTVRPNVVKATVKPAAKPVQKAKPGPVKKEVVVTPVKPAKAAPQKATQKVNLPPKASAPAVSGKGFSVQTGSFTTEKAARDVASDLSGRGYKSRIERVEVKGRAFFRVYVAAGNSQTQAQDVENQIKALKTYDTLIVKDK